MRTDKYKVLARLNGGKFPKRQNLTPTSLAEAKAAELTDFEIYNVVDDPGEIQNLAGRNLVADDELQTQLKKEYADLVADSPAWVPTK